MTKYMNRPALTPSQEREIFPLLDAALQLPFGKAIAYTCSKTRADYLFRILNGEIYRNAIQSLSMYLPTEPLYGRGLYYHLVVEVRPKGIIIANLENPPLTATWKIIKCAAEKCNVALLTTELKFTISRLNKLRERHIEELGPIYVDIPTLTLQYAVPTLEEMIVVDIDTGTGPIAPPTLKDRAKIR